VPSIPDYINYQDVVKPTKKEYEFTSQIFFEIIETNKRFLAKYAQCRMKNEMTLGSFYQHREHDESIDEVMSDEILSERAAVSWINIIVEHIISRIDISPG
jgi:hypothetical protein